MASDSAQKIGPLRYKRLALFFSSVMGLVNVTLAARHNNMTAILNQLLTTYDSKLRPGFGGPPTEIKADFNIRSMGPISEVDMSYSMVAYFRQTWRDTRLRFEGPLEEMTVHIKLLERIWKPDTYFLNGHGSYLHTITTPNKLLRIKKDGTILYSMRLTIKARCPMYLHYFPYDEQMCPLQFGSYGYTQNELIYVWKNGANGSVVMAKGMTLSQFDLTGHPANNLTHSRINGDYSVLRVHFRLQRHMGFFLIQVYLPCTLIVVLSWVSFWINREATADRISLGITTVLTLTTLTLDSRKQLPQVPYATALDWFILICYGFIIASLLEFAGVHYFTKLGSGEFGITTDGGRPLRPDDSVTDPDLPSYVSLMNERERSASQENNRNSTVHFNDVTSKNNEKGSCLYSLLKCLQGSASYRRLLMARTSDHGVNSVSKIDRASRILFPLTFIVANVFYWVCYVS